MRPQRRDGLVLMYHRIADVAADPWGLAVSPRHFDEHLEVLCRRMRPLPLSALAAAREADAIQPNAVALTFDDGYADNLSAGVPRLQRWRVPATIFVVTGHLETGRPFWWDVLEAILLRPGILPPVLEMEIAGQGHQWDLRDQATLTEATWRRHRRWRAWTPPPTARHEAYFSLWERLRPLSERDRHRLLAELTRWARAGDRVTNGQVKSVPGRLSAGDLRRLVIGDLVEIGAHTVTHALLPSLTPAERRKEIQESRTALEELLGRSITSFAYPFGSYDDPTVGMVHAAGFVRACSTEPGRIAPSTDPFRIPRLSVPDCDGHGFDRFLSEWVMAT